MYLPPPRYALQQQPQPGVFIAQPYNPYGGRQQQQQQIQPQRSHSAKLFDNLGYIVHPLGILRLALILFLIGVIIATSLTRNRYFLVRTESGYDNSIWISTLVFACVGLATCLLIYFMNILNIIWLKFCRIIPWTLIFAVFDLSWCIAMLILASFCASREGYFQGTGWDFRVFSMNKGAFGCAAGFGLFTGLLFLVTGILEVFYGLKWMQRETEISQYEKGIRRI